MNKHILRLLPFLFLCLMAMPLSGCEVITCTLSICTSGQSTGNTSAPPSSTEVNTPSSPVTTPGNCNQRKETGVGNTTSYSFTVSNGCVAVVTGVNVTGIPQPWSDGGGGIEGLQPGSYTVTIKDGSYQIGTTAAGQAMWCNIYTWEQQNGKADTYNYPIDGWSSNCP